MGKLPYKAKINSAAKVANKWLMPQRPARPIVRRVHRHGRYIGHRYTRPRISAAAYRRQVKKNLFGI